LIKLLLRILLPIVVIAGAGYAGWTMIQNRPIPETRVVEVPLPLVETMDVAYSNVRLRVRAEGTVAPRTEAEFVPEVFGRVMEISPSLVVGGFFEEGEVLLRLDSREYELAVTRSRASIAQAELRLEIERQEAAVAMEEWELLGAGRPTALAMREPQIAEAEAALASAEAALQQAEYDLERAIVRAPFAGRVRSKRVDVGQFVQRGNSVATIYAVDAVEIRLPIPDSELQFVDLPLAYRGDGGSESVTGPEVILRSEFAGQEHEWRGRIVRTEGEIDPRTRMVHAIARVEDPYARSENRLRPPLALGMFVEAEILGRSSGQVAILPRSVLRGADQVLVVSVAGELRFQQVEILRLERDRVLVSSGVAEGDQIVVSPLENAVNGMRVRVIEEAPGEETAGESGAAGMGLIGE
jgi:multidrug efflux system membrane fusion protein